jgi:endonuclease-8
MAEGDTILRAARRLERALAGKAVRVRTPNPRGRAAGVERLDGMTVEAVRAHGKNLIVEFGELSLHSHLGMNGSWHVYGPGEPRRRSDRSAWLVLAAEDGVEAVQYGGPTLRVLPARALRRDPALARLGPDLLAPDFDPGDSIRLLRGAPGRELGDALLDQGKVAGIGNIFKSEACFSARLDPWLPVGELSDEDLERVLLAARRLMLDAVESRRHPYATYKRAGRPCPRCGTPIRSRRQGDDNRTTYWCPRCQAVSQQAGPGTNGP